MISQKTHIKNLSKKIYPLILGIGIPASLRSTAQYLQQMIDTMYIGQYNSESLAALSSIALPIWMVDSLWFGLGLSTTVMVAQRLGAKKQKDAAAVVKASLIIGAVLSAIYLIIWRALPQHVVRLMGLEGHSASEALRYLDSFTWVYIFRILCYILPASVLEAQGKTKILMASGLVQTFVNVILDPIFIWTFGLGIQGAAIATVLAEAVGAFIISWYFWRRNTLGMRGIKKLPLHWDIRERLTLALPQSAMNMSWALVASVAISMMNRALPLGSAIFNVGFMLSDFSFRILLGFDSAVTSLAGRAFGAKRIDRIYAVLRAGFVMKTLFGLSVISLLVIFREQIVRLFTNDPYIGDNILKNIPWLIGITLLNMYTGIFISTLHAMGKSRWNMAIGFACDLVRLSVQYFAVIFWGWGVSGAYFAIVIQEICRYGLEITVVLRYLKRYGKLWALKWDIPDDDKPVLNIGQETHPFK